LWYERHLSCVCDRRGEQQQTLCVGQIRPLQSRHRPAHELTNLLTLHTYSYHAFQPPQSLCPNHTIRPEYSDTQNDAFIPLSSRPTMPHQANSGATSSQVPRNPVDCPVLVAMVIDPLLASFNPELHLCRRDDYDDYVWPLATILWLLVLYTAIRGVEKFNSRNVRTRGFGGEEYEMVDLRERR
jgi:hypothetical protein